MKFSLPQNRFLRQLFGAATGALVALALYSAYGAVAPRLQAMLPQAPVSAEDQAAREREERKDSVVLRARQLLEARSQ